MVIDRKSIVHSMVEFMDGTIMANIAPKSMEIPIAYALNYPNRLSNNIEKLNIFDIGSINFEKPDFNKFGCLNLAIDAIKMGHSAQVVLNAADEVLVEAFLNDKIKYTDIYKYLKIMLDNHECVKVNTIRDILKLDKIVKEETKKIIEDI